MRLSQAHCSTHPVEGAVGNHARAVGAISEKVIEVRRVQEGVATRLDWGERVQNRVCKGSLEVTVSLSFEPCLDLFTRLAAEHLIDREQVVEARPVGVEDDGAFTIGRGTHDCLADVFGLVEDADRLTGQVVRLAHLL